MKDGSLRKSARKGIYIGGYKDIRYLLRTCKLLNEINLCEKSSEESFNRLVCLRFYSIRMSAQSIPRHKRSIASIRATSLAILGFLLIRDSSSLARNTILCLALSSVRQTFIVWFYRWPRIHITCDGTFRLSPWQKRYRNTHVSQVITEGIMTRKRRYIYSKYRITPVSGLTRTWQHCRQAHMTSV